MAAKQATLCKMSLSQLVQIQIISKRTGISPAGNSRAGNLISGISGGVGNS
jgi:hypothetical protein